MTKINIEHDCPLKGLKDELKFLDFPVEKWTEKEYDSLYIKVHGTKYKDKVCTVKDCENVEIKNLLHIYDYYHPKLCKLQPITSLNDLYPYIKPLTGSFAHWKKNDIDSLIKYLKCRISIDCSNTSSKIIEAFQTFYIEWHFYLDANPLVKKELDPVYVLLTFIQNQQETLIIPQGMQQIINDWNLRTNSEQALQVNNTLFLFSFTNVIQAWSFQSYVAGRLNNNNLRVRLFSSNDMLTF